MTVLYPNPCYSAVCYEVTAVYIENMQIAGPPISSGSALFHKTNAIFRERNAIFFGNNNI